MTPDRTQSNPRLSDALAEQTIAEADGVERRVPSLTDVAEALGACRAEDGAPLLMTWEDALEYMRDMREELAAATRRAPVLSAAPGSALTRFVEAADVMRQGGFDSSCMRTSRVRAKYEYDAARAALLAASETETMPPDSDPPTPVTHGALPPDPCCGKCGRRESDWRAADGLGGCREGGRHTYDAPTVEEHERLLREADADGYRRCTEDVVAHYAAVDDSIEIDDFVESIDLGGHLGAAARGKEGGE